MSTPQTTDCTAAELLEHLLEYRHQLVRDRDKYLGIIERALTEVLEMSVRGGGNVLGDYLNSNSQLILNEIREKIPSSLNEHNRDLLFRTIEILNEVNE